MAQLLSIQSKGEPYLSLNIKFEEEKLLLLEINARQSGESIYIEWMPESLVVKRDRGGEKQLYILNGPSQLKWPSGVSIKESLKELIDELKASSKEKPFKKTLDLVKKLIDEAEFSF